jgi:hypothetical protein
VSDEDIVETLELFADIVKRGKGIVNVMILDASWLAEAADQIRTMRHALAHIAAPDLPGGADALELCERAPESDVRLALAHSTRHAREALRQLNEERS